MKNPIQFYLRELTKQLRAKDIFDLDALAEIESHLLDSVEANLRLGLNQTEAEREALNRFGSVDVVSSTFEHERINPMQKMLLTISVVSGLLITSMQKTLYGIGVGFGLFIPAVDKHLTWDDTGITASVILLLCGSISLIGYRRPWLLAMVVGAWIPLYGIFTYGIHNAGTILALIAAFLGAYAGWALRVGMRKTFRTA